MRGRVCVAVAMAVAGMWGSAARAVIVLNGDATGRNTSAPTGPFAGSGWDLQGTYGSFLGTPIAPNWFITASHVGTASKLVLGGDHNVVETHAIAGTDLVLKRVDTPFTNWATLYDPSGDGALTTADPLVVFGRGTQRGSAVTGGWAWGSIDGVKSWGSNHPDALVNSNVGTLLAFDFDQTGDDSEGVLSDHDSAGGVFVFKNGQWKLAGINYGVELFYTAPSSDAELKAALYDARGYYEYLGDANNNNTNDAGDYQLVTGASAVPQTSYASYVGDSLSEIQATVPEPMAVGTAGVLGLLLLRRRNRA